VSQPEPRPDEVRHYLRRLLLSISIGVVLMATAAIWAYLTYGKRLETRAPLPKGAPPMAADSGRPP